MIISIFFSLHFLHSSPNRSLRTWSSPLHKWGQLRICEDPLFSFSSDKKKKCFPKLNETMHFPLQNEIQIFKGYLKKKKKKKQKQGYLFWLVGALACSCWLLIIHCHILLSFLHLFFQV